MGANRSPCGGRRPNWKPASGQVIRHASQVDTGFISSTSAVSKSTKIISMRNCSISRYNELDRKELSKTEAVDALWSGGFYVHYL